MENGQKKWYKTWWGILFSIVFFPFVIPYLIWQILSIPKAIKIFLILCWILFIIFISSQDPANTKDISKNTIDKENLIFGKYTSEECFQDKEGCFFHYSVVITMDMIAKNGNYIELSDKAITLCEDYQSKEYTNTDGLVFFFDSFEVKGDKFLTKIKPKYYGKEYPLVSCLMEYSNSFNSVIISE